MTNPDALTCHVCGNPLAEPLTYCTNCDRPFHLRLREDAPGTDCGTVAINDQYLTLDYTCNVCLGISPELDHKPEPPIHHAH